MPPTSPRPSVTSSSRSHIRHPSNNSDVQPHSKKAGHSSAVNSDYGPPLPDPAGDRLSRRAIKSARDASNDVPPLPNPASPARLFRHRYKTYNSCYSPSPTDYTATDILLRARELLQARGVELAPDQPIVSPLPDPVRDQNHEQNEQSNSESTGYSAPKNADCIPTIHDTASDLLDRQIEGVGTPENLNDSPQFKTIVTTVPRSLVRRTARGSGYQHSQPRPARFQPYPQAGRRNAVSLNSGNPGRTPNTHPLPEYVTHTPSSHTRHISEPLPTIGEFYTSWNPNANPDVNPLFAPDAAKKLDNVNHARRVRRPSALSNAVSTHDDEMKGQQGSEKMNIDSSERSPTSLPSHMHPTGYRTSSDQRRKSARDAFTTPNNPIPNDSPLFSSPSSTPGPPTFSQSAGNTTASSRRPAQDKTGRLWRAMYEKNAANVQRDLATMKSKGTEDIDLGKLVIQEKSDEMGKK
ncbi:hypothetical protein OCU04_008793 [Sclerotinia nivalis]|uniref:Uncharacterized protein n=1 Tax=Sclerotinia nivalis TaxID=352851 RepID=A0A9X0AHE1_9HELO|nr:hypothetical protein OCU04_008793 [Sclerotinia nivalis]